MDESFPQHMPVLAGIFTPRLKWHLPEIFGALASGGSALTSFQVQAQWYFSVLAAAIAAISGLLTIRSLLKKSKTSRPSSP